MTESGKEKNVTLETIFENGKKSDSNGSEDVVELPQTISVPLYQW